MAIDSGSPPSPEDLRWLLEPPRWGEIKIRLAIGRDAALTPEFREAVERLADAMVQAEVLANADLLVYGDGLRATPPFFIRNDRAIGTVNLLIDFYCSPEKGTHEIPEAL
jgi:hypothetical protein